MSKVRERAVRASSALISGDPSTVQVRLDAREAIRELIEENCYLERQLVNAEESEFSRPRAETLAMIERREEFYG